MEDSIISRRYLLAALGTTTVAGCMDLTPTNSNDATTEDETGIPLGSLFVSNNRGESQPIQLELKREGEIAYEDTLEVPDEGEVLDPVWSTEPAEYTLHWETEENQGKASIPTDFHIADSEECHYLHFNFGLEQMSPLVDLLTTEDIETNAGTC